MYLHYHVLITFQSDFNVLILKSLCTACGLGTYQDQYETSQCTPCKSGTDADKVGFEACIDCPYRLNITTGSKLCSVCDNGFFLNDMSIITTTIFENPFEYCDRCPDKTTICKRNTTLYNLVIQPGFWCLTRETSSIYSCKSDTV